jgi:hypothetical protein
LNQHNHKKIDDIIKRIEEKEESNKKSAINSEESEKYFRAKYQLEKSLWKLHKDNPFMLHNTFDSEKQAWVYVGPDCTAQKCVPECPFFPDTGEMIRNSEGKTYFHYDDSNLEEGFYGTADAVKERHKIAAMTPEQVDEYRKVDQEGVCWKQPEFTEETKQFMINLTREDITQEQLAYKTKK